MHEYSTTHDGAQTLITVSVGIYAESTDHSRTCNERPHCCPSLFITTFLFLFCFVFVFCFRVFFCCSFSSVVVVIVVVVFVVCWGEGAGGLSRL